MTDSVPAGANSQPAPPSPPARTGAGNSGKEGGLFHELVSDLNPLQYIPVIGTIYRAITGDEGNPTLRFVASLGTSFALGGPVGVAITAGEKLAGIDPERMVLDAARHLFHLGHAEPAAGAAPVAPAPATPAVPDDIPASGLAFAMNTRDLSADDLNGLELQRLHA
jgi:hypothetical protein